MTTTTTRRRVARLAAASALSLATLGVVSAATTDFASAATCCGSLSIAYRYDLPPAKPYLVSVYGRAAKYYNPTTTRAEASACGARTRSPTTSLPARTPPRGTAARPSSSSPSPGGRSTRTGARMRSTPGSASSTGRPRARGHRDVPRHRELLRRHLGPHLGPCRCDGPEGKISAAGLPPSNSTTVGPASLRRSTPTARPDDTNDRQPAMSSRRLSGSAGPIGRGKPRDAVIMTYRVAPGSTDSCCDSTILRGDNPACGEATRPPVVRDHAQLPQLAGGSQQVDEDRDQFRGVAVPPGVD